MMNTNTTTKNPATPAMDALRWFLDRTEGKVLTRAQHQMFENLYNDARTEQRALTLAN